MNEEQALTILVQASRQAQLNYSDHVALDRAHAILAKSLGIVVNSDLKENKEPDGEEKVKVS